MPLVTRCPRWPTVSNQPSRPQLLLPIPGQKKKDPENPKSSDSFQVQNVSKARRNQRRTALRSLCGKRYGGNHAVKICILKSSHLLLWMKYMCFWPFSLRPDRASSSSSTSLFSPWASCKTWLAGLLNL